MIRLRGKGPGVPVLALASCMAVAAACTNPPAPPPTTTTTTTTTSTTSTSPAPHGDHGDPAPGAPYRSVDDPRLSAGQRQRATDLIARTQVGMRRFPNEWSLLLAGYTTIGDSDSGYEHLVNWPLLEDGRELDAEAIESVVLEVKPGQPKRVVAAMYFLENGKTMADTPDIAGPLTTWHNHKDLCWDPSGRRLLGVFRLGRCIPLGARRELNPMLHVWVTPQPCGPFAEVDDTNGIIDRWLRSTGQLPPKPPSDGCGHVQHGEHA